MQHTYSKNYMPHCMHYLRSFCYRDSCPFIHVNLGPNAEPCRFFIKDGFCKKGKDCDHLHITHCESWLKTNTCYDENCSFHHPGRKTALLEERLHAELGMDPEIVSQLESKQALEQLAENILNSRNKKTTFDREKALQEELNAEISSNIDDRPSEKLLESDFIKF